MVVKGLKMPVDIGLCIELIEVLLQMVFKNDIPKWGQKIFNINL